MASDGVLSADDSVDRLYHTVARGENPLRSLRAAFGTGTSDFWRSHVRLERPIRGGPTSLGPNRIDHIILNAILPVLQHEAVRRCDRTVETAIRTVLRSMPAEDDEIIRRYNQIGLPMRSAAITQGFHELHESLCSSLGCLRCRIGRAILSER